MSTGILHNDDGFIRSLRQSSSFPLNIADKRQSKYTRDLCHQRLNDPAARLCYDDGSALISIPIHVFRPQHERVVIKTLKGLRDHHGIVEASTPTGTSSSKMLPSSVTEDDPPCRMIFLHASSSRSKLKISKIMLLELMTFHAVMPELLDFVHIFGESQNAKETNFSAFRERDNLSLMSSAMQPVAHLNRSGRGYELCYNLKTVDCRSDPKDMHKVEWATHHLAIYHKFDIGTSKALWIFIQGSSDIEERVREIVGPDGRSDVQSFSTLSESFTSTLTMHATLAQRASESWRWYVRWLETKCENETKLLMTEPREPEQFWRYSTEKDPDDKRTVYTAKHLQDVQKLVEVIRDAAGAIEDNIDIITALALHYKALASRITFPRNAGVDANTSDFVRNLENMAFELRRQHKRATTLAQRAEERRNLLMQYVNAQATETQERLANSTYEVGLAAQKEAIVMRIITVVTLVFLPATFVSTFFSTDIVKYQDNDHTASWSDEAMNRWLQVTIPLTVLTLLIAGIGYRYERKRQTRKQQMKHMKHLSDPEKAFGKEV